MVRKKRDPRAKGVPGRLRADKERREIETKERALRRVCLTLQKLDSAAARTSTPADADAAPATDTQSSTSPPSSDAIRAAFQELRRLALAPHGFVSDEFRQLIWPFLTGSNGIELHAKDDPQHFVARSTRPHRDDNQIEKDIDRSLWHYDVVRSIRESERRTKRRGLTHVIHAVLCDNDELHYYQGYHDVCSVFVLAMRDERAAFAAMARVSATYQREPMRKNFATVMHATRLLFPLLATEDDELFAHIQASSVEPFFALPWMITWFAHQLQRFHDVARLFDVLLVSHPLFCLYLSAAVVLEARIRVLQCECDFGTMHSLLAKLPLSMDVERVIARAALLLHTTPPATLLAHNDINADAAAAIHESTFVTFPFAFQQHFGVETPYVYVPLAVAKKHHARSSLWATVKTTRGMPLATLCYNADARPAAAVAMLCGLYTTMADAIASANNNSSFFVRAAALGVVAAFASLAYRSRIQPGL